MNPKTKFKIRFYVRPALSITFTFVGVFIASQGLPTEIVGGSRIVILAIAGIAFALLGFNLPELVEIIGKWGVTAIAMQIMREIPKEAYNVAQLPFGQKHEEVPSNYKNPIVVDTSVLIDGRIGDIVRSGFISGELLIIPSVISELHALADSGDSLKRAKGRRGLDLLAEIRKSRDVKVIVLDIDPEAETVDEKLVKLAAKLHARVMTMDYNLNKVAKVRGVTTLNINELANAVKTKVLPGEELEIDIKAVGKTKDQGVGYLEDGTMVVVEGGARMRGQNMTVAVMKVLQTAAGRMIFGKPK
ncbi:hypothetical protein HY024_03670 [Candidatus Curtissbacteria bacterium]|nr:hypothetical protein [Candidatus Curtissbacteria bacterium]